VVKLVPLQVSPLLPTSKT